MKRSEAIAYMTQEYAQSFEGGNSEMGDLERMNFLLTKLEEIGMSAPSISVPTKAIFGNKEINVGNITTVRIWEPET